MDTAIEIMEEEDDDLVADAEQEASSSFLEQPQVGKSERPLFKGLREEWAKRQFSDVTIFCRDNETIRSHRMVLAALSPMLRRALERDPTKENDSTILMPDVEADDLVQFLEKAYTGGLEEVRIGQEIQFLGFTDAVMVQPQYKVTGGLPVKVELQEDDDEEDEEEEEGGSLNYILPGRDRKSQPTVEEREEQILLMRANDPKQPIPRSHRSKPGTSHVWNFYKMTQKKTWVMCKECDKRFKNGSGITSTLARHLKTAHDFLFDELQKMNEEMERKLTRPEVISEEGEEEEEEEDDEEEEDEDEDEEEEEEEEDASDDEEKPKRQQRKSRRGKKNTRTYSKRSPVWKFFNIIGPEKASCSVGDCGKTFTTTMGTTTNLARHLENKHPEAYEEVRTQGAEKRIKKESEEEEEDAEKVDNEGCDDDDDDDVKVGAKLKTVSARKKNAIWNYFDHTDVANVHSCRACFKNQGCKPKSFTNLIRHLRLNHERLYRQFMTDCGYDGDQIEEMVNRRPKKRGPKPLFEDEDPASRTCPDCGKVYSKRKGMLVHIDAVHSGKRPFVCEECGMSFSRKESFKRHNHDNNRPYLCSVCGKTFARRHIRDIHERAHYGDKRYPCAFCEKKFVTNQKKTIHERIHTGEKPFECKDCGKKFVQKHQLQTHSRIHTGARPYRCDHCSQMFRHLSTKAKHNCPGKPREQVSSSSSSHHHQQQSQHQDQQHHQQRHHSYQGQLEVYDNKETIII